MFTLHALTYALAVKLCHRVAKRLKSNALMLLTRPHLEDWQGVAEGLHMPKKAVLN